MAFDSTFRTSFMHAELQIKLHTKKLKRGSVRVRSGQDVKTFFLRIERDTVRRTPKMQFELTSSKLEYYIKDTIQKAAKDVQVISIEDFLKTARSNS